MKVFRKILWLLASLFILAVIWESISLIFNSPLFPSIIQIVPVFGKVLFNDITYSHLSASVFLVIKGFSLSVLLALPTGILSFKLKIFSKLVLPFHEFIRYVPVPAFVPLCAALFGVGDLTKVVLIFIGTYFQLIFLFIADLNSQPKEYEESARTLGLKGFKLLILINLRSSLSDMLQTVRITFAWAWSYLLVAEVVNAQRGIGYLVLQSYRVLNMERLVALLIVIGVFGVVVDGLLKTLRFRICPWIRYEK